MNEKSVMNKIMVLSLALLFALTLNSCSRITTITTHFTSTVTSTITITTQSTETVTSTITIISTQPVLTGLLKVVSITEPPVSPNPAGGTLYISLMNISNETITSLFVTLNGFIVPFDVSNSNPLLPGQTITGSHLLLSTGFIFNYSYPLSLKGTTQSGALFDDTVIAQVKS
jgi:hypothetical protein